MTLEGVGLGVAERVTALDWERLAAALDERGFATTGPLLDAGACSALAGAYDDDALFRSRVVMQRHAFGQGEYRYFRAPLPPPVQALRSAFYPPLARVANAWRERLRPKPDDGEPFPPDLPTYLARCHAAGQTKPTPLLLRYEEGGHNCLHQDLYGPLVFPLQVTVLLSEPGRDFDGGEFLIVEQRPRMQSRGHVVPLGRGEAVIFAVNERPAEGRRGFHRVRLRHGVGTVRSGRRHALGVIFHDAG